MPAFPCQTCQQINVAPLSDYEANEQTLPPVPLPFVEAGTFVNEAVYFKLNCAEGEVPVFTGTLPAWITIDAENCQLVGAPGTFTGGGEGGVTAVNGVAQEFLDDFAVDSVISGELTPPPLPVFPDTTSNGETSIPLGTPAGQEAVFTGVLPGWITINNEDGTLEADPGFFTGTSGVNADINAENALQEFLNEAVTSGELTFQPIPPPPPTPPVVVPNWSALAWDVPFIGTNGAGIATFFPDSVSQSTCTADAQSADGGAVDSGVAQNTATLSYNGPAVNCNAAVVCSKTGDVAFLCGGVTISTPSVTLVNADFNSLAAGPHNFPFTIPDTGGVPVVITVSVFVQAPCLGTAAGALQIGLACSFTNV